MIKTAAVVRFPLDIKTLLAKAHAGKNLTDDPGIPAAAGIEPGAAAWQAVGTFGYDFDLWARAATLVAGCRAPSQGFNDGDGSRRFKSDLILHGPLLGLGVQF